MTSSTLSGSRTTRYKNQKENNQVCSKCSIRIVENVPIYRGPGCAIFPNFLIHCLQSYALSQLEKKIFCINMT